MNMRFVSLLLVLFLGSPFASSQLPDSQSRSEKQSPPTSSPTLATPDLKETLATAHQKLEHGDPQQAVAVLEQLVATGKASVPGVQHELGIAYYRTGKLLSAEKAFAQAMTEDPNDMESVQMRGLSLYR